MTVECLATERGGGGEVLVEGLSVRPFIYPPLPHHPAHSGVEWR